MGFYNNKTVLVTLTKENGNTVSKTKLLHVDKILDAETSGTKVLISYQGDDGRQELLTGTLTLAELNNAINNLPTPGARELIGVFDCTGGGKTAGAYNFKDLAGNDLVIPDNSRIIDGFYEVTTTFTSATDAATISLGIPTDDVAGVKAATAISTGTTYDAAAPKAVIQDGTLTNISEKTTADRPFQATVAVETVTAGVMYVWLKIITTA